MSYEATEDNNLTSYTHDITDCLLLAKSLGCNLLQHVLVRQSRLLNELTRIMRQISWPTVF